jgi:PhzF family phenazine biosynthesis protein
MSRLFHLVDAFTSAAFRGNPAAVYVLDNWLADASLQTIAREMNQSETAFVVPQAQGYALRWFTPTIEVDLCGHATLAAAHVLWSEASAQSDEPVVFTSRSGQLGARRNGTSIELDFPLWPEEQIAAPDGLAAALGVRPTYIGKSRRDLIVQVETETEVRESQPNFAQLAKIATRGVIVTAKSDNPEFDFVSRFFAPAAGINEDPVTGSAHCCLADFWHKRLQKTSFLAYQASIRGGVVSVSMLGDRVTLGGEAVTVARGELVCEPS